MIFSLKGAFFSALLFIFLFIPQNEVKSSMESEIIGGWADRFGEELWDLAQKMTKANEIRMKYKSLNARVEKKDGNSLIDSIVESIGRMLNRKMDAVKCIVNKSEEYAEEFHNSEMADEYFSYYSSKFSFVNGLNLTDEKYPASVEEWMNNSTFRNMTFDRDSHFFDLEVSTSHSSVHVPTNVYDHSPEAGEFIQWSEVLDDVFTQNYQSDPALSWQYFGSNLGVMRHYPAMSWNRNETDTYDCRKRSWYIETATCSKDVVILLDNSGSMTGYRNYIAQLTIKSLLDTFSNNDFVNIFNYSKGIDEIVPCFKDMLVQATPENIKVFNEKVAELQPEGHADIKSALSKAFELLEKYRHIRKCNESSTGCNQAIMLVTDGVSGNATEIFEKYNSLHTNHTSPVRMFTYLLGKEVTKVKEIQLYACLNRGYYSHVQSLDEVAEEVLKYVNVVAAPLVLQKNEHPPTWTHAFIDTTHETDNDASNDKDPVLRMMIAVGVPAYNLSSYGEFNYTGRPQLLGVAGTDVPLDDINKLALPYKLGVNGYSFIVSNNGYVLLHPDLRPFDSNHKGILKENYNSIDLTEIEQMDEELPPRVPTDVLLELRSNLVEHKKGQILDTAVRFHYDKMRRVAQRKQDFYFAPIPHTPFSLGLALPHDYGNTWIKVGDEIQRNNYTKINISDFFVGENWKVHPEWVYCKYHYLEGHEFNNSEDELRHFLKKIIEPHWKWSQQYEPDANADREKETDELNCGRKSLDDDAYFCNKELVELLVFDAKVTNDSYRSWEFESDEERDLIERYNATVRFVGTMSGLTRWQFIFGEVEVDFDQEFGDFHSTAINEAWYKSAILQHDIDKQSFVYSVPHASDEKEDSEIKVTASMAIFPRDGGLEAPSCVVGFQFSHQLMYERFVEITSKVKCDDCIRSCSSDDKECFVIDNNGYIVISENANHTGMFFGQIYGANMESMVYANIFKKLAIYDLQGLCKIVRPVYSKGSVLLTPLKLLFLGIKWIFTEMIVELSRLNLWIQGVPHSDDVYDDADYTDGLDSTRSEERDRKKVPRKGVNVEEIEYFKLQSERRKKNETIYYACDKKSDLYVLQQDFIRDGRGYILDEPTNGSRPFFVNRIPRSNLLLVVVDTKHEMTDIKLSTEPVELTVEDVYNVTHPCHKLYMNTLPRRRLDECFTEHPDEEEMAYCGSSTRIKFTLLSMLLPMFYLVRFSWK